MSAAGPGKARSVIVTGASRGIGLAVVRRFKAQGWAVAAASGTESVLGVSEADFAAVCDVTDAGAVRDWVAAAHARLGRLDAVINCAGLAGANSLDPADADDFWHRILAVNLTGTYHVCKHAAPRLPNGEGRIINVASVLGLRGVPDQTAYCAAKHGVIGLTRSLAHALAPRRITVNAICPGWTRTAMAEGRMRELGLTEAALAASVPLGRFIEPEEVADLALFLAGPGAAGMTGQALTLDGGTLA